jgi:CRISPR-associated endonuclease/helicase Cas3
MSLLQPEQFDEFYEAANGYSPFPWQRRLARRVCEGDWPHAIALPTAAGKTACIDIALFALACGLKCAPRRIFFVVDRRIVVDQAWEHAKNLAKKLATPESAIEKLLARSLCEIAQDERPLDVYALRGGMYRETAWAHSPLQPTVIASTVDQVGSRLLFRGYGVSDSMKPIHAGLVGNDALILLDEAHCARPFDQTMQLVKKYRELGEGIKPPFQFVSLTATPTGDGPTERDDEEDRAHPVLGKRITASKPTRLVIAEKAKGRNATAELVKMLERNALELSKEFACVGIIVNRVKTARELKAKLGDDAVLLTGRMRPLDRDKLLKEKLTPLVSNAEGIPPKFVIGTQCLECGADFDFHAMVTECASLDALRQRFGRLNRVAKRPTAKAVIVIRGDQTESKEKESERDPVYDNSLAHTWKWLLNQADGKTVDHLPWIDFSIASIRVKWDGTPVETRTQVNAPASDAAVLFPAHLDCWVQTNPVPALDPDPALFLHGAARPGQPDVQVVFRSDLGGDPDLWDDVVSLCPPSSSETVPVPIRMFKAWLAAEDLDDQTGDVEGEAIDAGETETVTRAALCWRGPEKSQIVEHPSEVAPDDVYIIPCAAEGAESLGDFPFGLTDYAEEAFQRSRDKGVLRLPGLELDENSADFEELLSDAVRIAIAAQHPDWPSDLVDHLVQKTKRIYDPYPEPLKGFIVTGKTRLHKFDPTYLEDSEPNESFRGRPVTLVEHSRGVAEHAMHFARGCGLDENLYAQAGLWHDLGKLDPRFQAMLKQSSPRTAVGSPLAKSAQSPRTQAEREEARQVHRYPRGARHELLSAALVAGKTNDDLLLHLIATHHGSAHPFADPVMENEAANTPCKQELFGLKPESCRQNIEAWNAELPERFWRVVRKFGWWGAAYREAIFRLADHAQSRAEQEVKQKAANQSEANPLPFAEFGAPHPEHRVPLPGLDGANPLAYLAALGTLVVFDRMAQMQDRPPWLEGTVALSWERQRPVLHFPALPPTPELLVQYLAERWPSSLDQHPAKVAISLFENKDELARQIRYSARRSGLAEPAALDWIVAQVSEIAPEATSQLLTVRRDYFPDNLRSILGRCRSEHLYRALFRPWDYADALDNQSLHWEPSEDRRHAYQWYMPSGDPTRRTRGGMLGANRLALEAWPLFPSFPTGDRLATRGFQGNRARDTFWIWPLWHPPLTRDAVASMLGLKFAPATEMTPPYFRPFGVFAVFRLQRIVVGKTPNFTKAVAIA